MESEFKYSKILKEKGDEFIMAYFRKYPEDMLISSGIRANNKGQYIKITIECKNRNCGQFDIYYKPAELSFEPDTQYIRGAGAHDAEIRVLKVWDELNAKAGL